MSSDEEKLTAHLDEDEATAKAAGGFLDSGTREELVHDLGAFQFRGGPLAAAAIEHIARHRPARALRYVEAVRLIIRESSGEGHGWAEHEPAYYAGLGYAVTLLAEVYNES